MFRIVIGQQAPVGVADLPLGECVLLVVGDAEFTGLVSGRRFIEGRVVSVSFSEAPKPGEFVPLSIWTVDIP